MRRTLQIIAVLAALGAAATAQAGVRALYDDPSGSKQLQVDVQDNGDARIADTSTDDYGLLIGGEFYIVDVEDGKAKVARLKDVATAMGQVLPPIFKGLFEKLGDVKSP